MAKSKNSEAKNAASSEAEEVLESSGTAKSKTAKAKKAPAKRKAAPKKAAAAKKSVAKAKSVTTNEDQTLKESAPVTGNGEAPALAPNPAPRPAGEGERKERPRVQVNYSDEDLEMFRENISNARIEAVEEFQILKEHLDDLTNNEQADENASYSMHMAEQGTEAQEKEKIYAQVQRLNDYIKKLDDALERIQNKTYGICRICGCLIAKERLLAVPITTLSASYKIRKRCPEDGVDRIIARGQQ